MIVRCGLPPRQVLFGTGSGAVQVASQFGGAGGAGELASRRNAGDGSSAVCGRKVSV